MAEGTLPGRWRCPACGTALEPAASANRPDERRLLCPGCGGRFRIRRRADSPNTATISGEIPASATIRPAVEPPAVGGVGLAVRGGLLNALAALYHAGNAAGAAILFVLGGFVPVGRGWLRDEITDWPGVLKALGGVPISAETTDPDADLGPVLARADAPDLFAEVGEVARRLGARPPGQVRLTYLPCCGVVAWGRSRALVLGLPLLYVLTRSELRAVLGHELAHLARGDASAAARASRFVQGLAGALDAEPRPSLSPLRVWARLCRRWAESLHAPLARGREARADRASAGLSGGDAAASSLVKVAAVQGLFREVLDAYDPSDPTSPNLYVFFRRFWERLPEPLLAAIRHDLLRDGYAAADPAHPPLLDRLAAVQAYPPRPSFEGDSAPASSVLGDLEAMEQMLHNRLFAARTIEPSLFHRAGS